MSLQPEREYQREKAAVDYDYERGEISQPKHRTVLRELRNEYAEILLDEVASLRAAITEWAEAKQAAEWFELDQTNAYGDDHREAEYRVEAAEKVLFVLSGKEEA